MDESVLREVQHTPERNVEAMLPGTTDGYNISVDHADQADAIRRFWTTNQPYFKALFAKKLNVQEPAKQGVNVSKINVQFRDPVTGVTRNIPLDDGRTGHQRYDPTTRTITYVP